MKKLPIEPEPQLVLKLFFNFGQFEPRCPYIKLFLELPTAS